MMKDLVNAPSEMLQNLYLDQRIPLKQLAELFGVRPIEIRWELINRGIRRNVEYGVIGRAKPKSVPINEPPIKLPYYERYKIDAIKRGHSFDPTEDQFFTLLAGDCYYCGRSPYKHSEYREIIRTGIDRTDNSRGYIFDNCRSCCGPCNIFKGSRDDRKFINMCKKIAARFEHEGIDTL